MQDLNKTTINGKNITLIKITKNGVLQKVAPWENITIDGGNYSKSGDKLYPEMNNRHVSHNLIDGQIITINSKQYKVKAVEIIKTKKVLESNSSIDNLVSNTTLNGINELKTRIDNNTLGNPNLTFDTTGIKEVKSWYESLSSKYNQIPVKVVNGKIQ